MRWLCRSKLSFDVVASATIGCFEGQAALCSDLRRSYSQRISSGLAAVKCFGSPIEGHLTVSLLSSVARNWSMNRHWLNYRQYVSLIFLMTPVIRMVMGEIPLDRGRYTLYEIMPFYFLSSLVHTIIPALIAIFTFRGTDEKSLALTAGPPTIVWSIIVGLSSEGHRVDVSSGMSLQSNIVGTAGYTFSSFVIMTIFVLFMSNTSKRISVIERVN
jgi:hypothetical protein